MKHFNFLITIVLAITLVLSSCKKDNFAPPGNTLVIEKPGIQQKEGPIVLGLQLEDPYSLKNMKQAYANLKAGNADVADLDIQPTHTYSRYLPKNEEEWGILKTDTTIVWYDYPLDYEIVNLGTTYHDPTLHENAITWQYCVVPIGHTMPDIHHELLYEVYIPAKDANSGLKSSTSTKQFLLALEHESVKLTGNLPENELKSTTGLLPAEWTPKGTIKVWDDMIGRTITYTQVFDHWEYYDCITGDPVLPPQPEQLAKIQPKIEPMMMQPIDQCQRAVYRYNPVEVAGSYIPLVQATVHARWFTHIESDLTDNNGYFETSKFNYEVNYAIKWERADFDIRSDNWGQAWYNGPKQKGDWNLNISQGGMSWIYAHIHRGAYTYYYANTYGIKTPPKDGQLLNQRIHIGAMEKSGRSHYYEFNKFWLSPQIKIYAYSNAGNWNIGEYIFGATVHELAHASHWEIGYTYGQYVVDAIFSEPFLPESWAQGVEAVITSNIYGNVWVQDQNIPLNGIIGNGGYTPIVWDMIDTVNQRAISGIALPIDNVSGYTLKQLEDALYGNYTWSSWRNAIRDNNVNPTEDNLTELFGNYK